MFALGQLGDLSWTAVQALPPETLASRQFSEPTTIEALNAHYATLLGNLGSDPRTAPSPHLSLVKLKTWMLPESGQPPHLTLHAPHPVIRTLCKFRLSSTTLQVRDHSIRDRTSRLCPICALMVEDEKHVLLECQAYKPLRQRPRWAFLFAARGVTMRGVMVHTDQYRLASFLVAVLRLRKQLLQEQATPPMSPPLLSQPDMFDSDDEITDI